MKTILLLLALIISTVSLSAQTLRLQQRTAHGQWLTVQTKSGASGSFTNIAAGSYRVCVDESGVSNCVENNAQGKGVTLPQSSPVNTSNTFRIANNDWVLTLQVQGTTIGWNWGKSATSSKNNAR